MTVKSFTLDGRVDSDFAALVRKAQPILEQVLGGAADRVEVTWEPAGEGPEGEPVVRARLTDDGVTRTAEFTAWDLSDEPTLRWRFYDLWDEVLAGRIRRIQEAVRRSLAEPVEA